MIIISYLSLKPLEVVDLLNKIRCDFLRGIRVEYWIIGDKFLFFRCLSVYELHIY
jgi:hypothetical protein